MNLDRDLEDLMAKFGSTWNGFVTEENMPTSAGMGHCSGIVRWTDDGKELFTAHTTW